MVRVTLTQGRSKLGKSTGVYLGTQTDIVRTRVGISEKFYRYRYIMSCATYPGAPRYGGVRTWIEGSKAHGNRALAEASNLRGWGLPQIQLFVMLKENTAVEY